MIQTKHIQRKDKYLGYLKTKIVDLQKSRTKLIWVCPIALKLANKRAKQLVDEITKAEKVIYDLLCEYDIEFDFQKVFIKGKEFRIVDFLIGNTVIEIDGDSHKGRSKKDALRTIWLKKQGIHKVIRFTNKQIFKYPEKCIDKTVREVIYSCM